MLGVPLPLQVLALFIDTLVRAHCGSEQEEIVVLLVIFNWQLTAENATFKVEPCPLARNFTPIKV